MIRPYVCNDKCITDNKSYKLLQGPEFAVLKEEYEDYKPEIRDKVSNVLVTLGGSDPRHFTLKVLEALNHISMKLSIKL